MGLSDCLMIFKAVGLGSVGRLALSRRDALKHQLSPQLFGIIRLLNTTMSSPSV